jgi:hypothetical protein
MNEQLLQLREKDVVPKAKSNLYFLYGNCWLSSSKGGNISVMSPQHQVNDVIRKWKINIKTTSKSSKGEPILFNNVLQLT